MASPDFQHTVYVGTYTSGESEGIYVCRMDPGTGALSRSSVTGGIKNPSFLAIAPGGRHLYAVSEIGDVQGPPQGGVSAFAIDARPGGLTLLNHQPSQGNGPCHLSVDATGRYVLVANYQSGSVGMLPIQPDGRLGPATEVRPALRVQRPPRPPEQPARALHHTGPDESLRPRRRPGHRPGLRPTGLTYKLEGWSRLTRPTTQFPAPARATSSSTPTAGTPTSSTSLTPQ